ncbi:MAG TPA: cytosine deaminase [Magnetospirillaceae bacterium]|jgi:cytosine deaminase
MTAFPPFPSGDSYRIVRARLPVCLLDASDGGDPSSEALIAVTLTIAGGKIAKIERSETAPPPPDGSPSIDLDGGMVWPTCTDLHTHLDKGFIWKRAPNPSGNWRDAIDAVRVDQTAHWTAEDVAARMEFGLRCAYAHGTSAIRTHIDSMGKQADISWPVLSEMRRRWQGRITLQGSALAPLGVFETAEGEHIANLVAEHGGVLGTFALDDANASPKLDRLFAMARDRNIDVDIHADETANPASNCLEQVAEATIRHAYQGRVTAGHCCSLSVRPPAEAARTIIKVAEAGMAIVSLPLCNLYLQDRQPAPHTPRWRGVTAIRELAAGGVAVAVGSDNTRDPFYAYGDLDPVEVFSQAVRIAHLDHPWGGWVRAITATPSTVMKVPGGGLLRTGAAADLILFRARGWVELLARPSAPRLVVRNGKALTETAPDYRELDAIL